MRRKTLHQREILSRASVPVSDELSLKMLGNISIMRAKYKKEDATRNVPSSMRRDLVRLPVMMTGIAMWKKSRWSSSPIVIAWTNLLLFEWTPNTPIRSGRKLRNKMLVKIDSHVGRKLLVMVAVVFYSFFMGVFKNQAYAKSIHLSESFQGTRKGMLTYA